MNRVFLYGYYGCGNVGDDLLLAVLLEKLLKSASSVRVKCLLAPDSSRDPHVTFLELEKILADQSRRAPVRLGLFLIQIWKALCGVQVLIFGGGTLFHAKDGSPTNLLILAFVAVLARLRGAKVAAIGVGVGKIRGGLPVLLFSGISRLSCDFAVRDKSSLENCAGCGESSRVRLAADLVFLYPLPSCKKRDRPRPILGLALAASAIGKGEEARALAPLGGVMDAIRERGWDVQGLSFQELEFSGFHLSDSELLNSIRDVPIRRLGAAAVDISEQIGGLDVVVGMRFHALVLAARLGIPFVGIGRDPKLADLCQRYGFPFFELEDLESGKLLAAVENVRGCTPDCRVTDELICEAEKNFDQIDRLML